MRAPAEDGNAAAAADDGRATDDPFGMHLLGDEASSRASDASDDGLEDGPAPAALPISTPGAGTSSGRRLAFEPSRLQMPATRLGRNSPTRAAILTNHSRRQVEIVDLIPTGRTPAITSNAIDSTLLAPGATTAVHFEFRPTRVGAYAESLVVETDRGPDVAIRVLGRALPVQSDAIAAHDPAAVAERDADERAVDTGRARQAAHAGRTPSVRTYAELEAAFSSALDFGQAGLYEQAHVLAAAVAARMHELSDPQLTGEVLDRLGVGRYGAQVELALATDATVDVSLRAANGYTIMPSLYLPALRQARQVLRLMTGESDDASELRALDRATTVTTALAATPAVVSLGLAAPSVVVEAGALAGGEVGLLAHATRGVFYTVSTWIATHPDEALAWSELFVAWGIEVGEDPAQVAHDLTTLDGWYRITRDIMFSILPVRAAAGGHGGDDGAGASLAPRRRGTGGHVDTADEPPSPRRAGAGDPGDEPAGAHPTGSSRARGVAPTRDAAAPSPAARRLADQTLDRLRAFVAVARTRKDALLARAGLGRKPRTGDSPDDRRRGVGHDEDQAEPRPPARAGVTTAAIHPQAAARARAAEALGQIAVTRVRGDAAHPHTYYIAEADGQRLPGLVADLDGFEVIPYKKGVILRDGADEWYFEFQPQAGTLTAGNAVAAERQGDLGLPAPNIGTVELWGYRGVREIRKPGDPAPRKREAWTDEERADVDMIVHEEPLIDFGHVGISFDGGKTIHGLTPQRPDGMELPELLRRLGKHEVFPGKVGDDTGPFDLARQLADDEGWNTRPVRVIEIVEPETKAALAAQVAAQTAMTPGEHNLGYQLPLKEPVDGQFFKGGTAGGKEFAACNSRNCATYPALLGLPIPESSGNMRHYMPLLESWAKADSPIDARTKEATP